jgi:phospholipid transport system transporter-binding protein
VKLSLELSSDNKSALGLIINGELDQTTLKHDYWSTLSDENQKSIIDNGALIVDLANVDRSDTAGLAWLINIVKDAKANKVEVSFKSVPDKLLNLAELSSAKLILA